MSEQIPPPQPTEPRPSYHLRPIPHQKELEEALEELSRMTPEQIFQTAVRAGIYTPDGELTEPYADDEP